MAEPRFTPETFRFLTELALNNSRTWFEANKARYEALVREPALAFIRGAGPHLRKISRHLVASDRKIGGSLMRVHRDVRFSRDKSPYKTNVGIQFRHEVGKDVHAPGLYVHIAPDECFLGAGVWHPDAQALGAIRRRIAEHPMLWKRASQSQRFLSEFALSGSSLTRPPKGFDPAHPWIEDLKRTDFIAVAPLSPREVTARDFPHAATARLGAGKPLMAFLCEALNLAF